MIITVDCADLYPDYQPPDQVGKKLNIRERRGRFENQLSVGDRIGRIIVRIFLIIWSLIVLYPMFWALQTSFKTNKEFYQNIWNFPEVYHFENYIDALEQGKGRHLLLKQLICHRPGDDRVAVHRLAWAYALGRSNNRFTCFMSNYFLLAYMIPSSIALIAQFFLMKNLNLVNSLEGLSSSISPTPSPFPFSSSPAFRTMPHELEEPAEIDGAGLFRTFVSVMLPPGQAGCDDHRHLQFPGLLE